MSQDASKRPWTSTLSVKEWASLSSLELEPIGQVMGSCFYHLGNLMYQTFYRGSQRLTSIENSFYECRELALNRLSNEAKVMGADAVVGVRLEKKSSDYFSRENEFIAMGTAVRMKSLPSAETPYLCTVTGQELIKLYAAGVLPVGLVLGISVQYLCSYDEPMRVFDFSNREMRFYTKQVYDARYHAMRNMKNQANRMMAEGILASETSLAVQAIEVNSQNQERTDHLLEFVSYGTAIRQLKTNKPIQEIGLVNFL
jgi:uncharacterized protein YbjQ (UPF0145 family)